MTRQSNTAAPTRRRVLEMSGALLGLSIPPGRAAAALTGGQLVTWHGIALGAAAEMQIAHVDRNEGRRILELAIAELRRLERIFSLYDETSALSRLNRYGALVAPPPELIEVISTALSLARATKGAFDPSVQVLWTRHAQGDHRAPLHKTLDLVGYQNVSVTPREIRLEHDAMALTLNGIAQGYITDRLVSLLRDAGLQDILIDCGEIYGAGKHPTGRLWQVSLADNPAGPLSCHNQAIATSAGTTAMPGISGQINHLFDPVSGTPARRYKSLSVIAPTAILADGLSTALSVLAENEWRDILSQFTGQNIQVCGVRENGTLIQISTG